MLSLYFSISEIQHLNNPIRPALLGECVAHTGAVNVSQRNTVAKFLRHYTQVW